MYHYGIPYMVLCKVETDSKFYAQYSNMVGTLAKIIRTPNSFKSVLIFFVRIDVSLTCVYYDLIG